MLERQTRPYEIFIRIGEGGVAHAHFGELEQVVDTATGEVVGNPRELPVVAVTIATAAEYLGEQNAAMLQQIAQLQSELADAEQRAAHAELDRDAAAARAELAEAALTAADKPGAAPADAVGTPVEEQA